MWPGAPAPVSFAVEHLKQAVIKLEMLLRAANSAHCADECAVIRSAQTVILDALLEVKIKPTLRCQRIDVLHPMRRLMEGVSEGDE